VKTTRLRHPTGPLSTERRGASLIEMVVVITLTATLMGLAAAILHMLLRLESTSREAIAERAAIAQLAGQFRRDVRAAESFSSGGQPEDTSSAVWELAAGPEQGIVYRAQPGTLVRSERQGDKELRRETFSLPDGASVSIEAPGENAARIVSLRIVPKPGAVESIAWRVDAALGKDRRFAPQESIAYSE